MNFWPFKRKHRVEYKIIERERTDLTLGEWRSNPTLVKSASVFMGNQYLRLALDVLRNSGPAHDVLHPMSPQEVRAAKQAQIEGYNTCLNNFEALAKFEQKPEIIEATFEKENEETEP